MNWQQVERKVTDNGTARVDMQTDGEGHYRFVVEHWIEATPEDEGALGDGTWQVEQVSGLYGWKTPCRNDAARALRLRDTRPQRA